MPYPQAIQERLAPYLNDSAGSLTEELAMARALLAEAVLAGRNHEAATLLQLVGRLSSTQIDNDIRTGKLLPAPAVRQLAQKLCEAIVRRLGHLPDYPALSDEIIGDFDRIFAAQRLLTHDPTGDDGT